MDRSSFTRGNRKAPWKWRVQRLVPPYISDLRIWYRDKKQENSRNIFHRTRICLCFLFLWVFLFLFLFVCFLKAEKSNSPLSVCETSRNGRVGERLMWIQRRADPDSVNAKEKNSLSIKHRIKERFFRKASAQKAKETEFKVGADFLLSTFCQGEKKGARKAAFSRQLSYPHPFVRLKSPLLLVYY